MKTPQDLAKIALDLLNGDHSAAAEKRREFYLKILLETPCCKAPVKSGTCPSCQRYARICSKCSRCAYCIRQK